MARRQDAPASGSVEGTAAVLYLRVSTDAQAKRDLPLDGQRAECLALAQRRGYRVVGEYVDAGITGQTDERDAFQRMVSEAGSAEWRVVIVWEYSRFSRKLWHQERYIEMLENLGVRVESATEGDSDWERVIRGKVAQDEARTIRERTMRGKRLGAERGQWVSSKTPYGYRVGPDHHLVVVPEEAAVVGLVIEWLRTGLNLYDACERLRDMGCATREGKRWRPGNLQRLLTNPVLAGHIVMRDYGGAMAEHRRSGGTGPPPEVISEIVCRNAHEALVDPEEIERFGLHRPRQLDFRGPREPWAHLKRYRAYPLSGLLECPCGWRYSVIATRPSKGIWWYACRGVPTSRDVRGARCYEGPALRSDRVEPEIWDQVWEDVVVPDRLRDVAKRVRVHEQRERAQAERRLVSVENELRRVDRKIANLLEAMEAGGARLHSLIHRTSDLEQEHNRLLAERARLATAVERTTAAAALPSNLDLLIERARRRLEGADRVVQNEFLRDVVERVTVGRDGGVAVVPREALPRLH